MHEFGRQTLLLRGCVWLLTLSVSWNVIAQDEKTYTKEELQTLYMDYLKGEGFRPEIDEDGDVVFKREGKLYFIAIDETDPHFFRLVFPNFWEIESFVEHQKVLLAIDYSNRLSKVSKLHTTTDNVWAGVETFVEDPKDFEPHFYRYIASIENGVRNYVSYMRDEVEE